MNPQKQKDDLFRLENLQKNKVFLSGQSIISCILGIMLIVYLQ